MNEAQKQIASLFTSTQLPIKDCGQCLYKQDPEGGHCYMFKHEPEGEFCGAFRRAALTLQRSVHIAVISLMDEQGIAQAELARRLKVSRSAVTQLFEQSWTMDRLQSVAEALGATVTIKLNASKEE